MNEEKQECLNCKKGYVQSTSKEFEKYCSAECEDEYKLEYAGELSQAKEDDEIDRLIDELRLEAKR